MSDNVIVATWQGLRTKQHRVYPGGWIKTNARSNLFVFVARCELCNQDKARVWYFNPKRGGVRCAPCQELRWDSEGYDIVNGEPVFRVGKRSQR
jgi:hypothetical protein